MIKPLPPANEEGRLAALRDLQILDTPEEPLFNAFTQLAAEVTGAGSAMISLLDQHRQWFKARRGFAPSESPRDTAFCGHVVQNGEALVVPDASADERFRDNPLVTSEPFIRFYAGVPLVTTEGFTIGTICVVDRAPRTLSASQQAALEALAQVLMAALYSRRRFIDLYDAQSEINLLQRAIDVAGDTILVYRAEAEGSLRLEYMNEACVHQTGYTREEAIGQTLQSFRQAMPDDDGMRAVRAGIAAGKPVEAELISYRKGGSIFWNQVSLYPIEDKHGSITHWVSIERDITDEVNRTAALEEEHDRLLTLTRSARRLFTALDTRTLVTTLREISNELLHVEARVLAVTDDGRCSALEERADSPVASDHSDSLVEDAIRLQTRVLSSKRDRAVAFAGRFGNAQYALDFRIDGDRTLRPTDVFVIDSIAEYFAVAARNVTLYHELDERRSAVLELSQSKSDLIAMLAHDFRGPLTSIVGFADLTGEVDVVTHEQQEFLDTIKRSALQLSELATDTLTLSRLERNEVSLQLGDVDIEELVRSVIAQYGDRRAVELVVTGDVRIVGDEGRLRQIFSNLIDNAIKYAPGGGIPDVTITGTRDQVTVSVRDRGIGIPTRELAGVFDRFWRASNARQLRIGGTGFGLFLTRQLVVLHGGTIGVESSEGEGSTFTVTLPRRVLRTSAPRTVVIIDPERERSFLAYGLREAGYRITTVANIEALLVLADSQTVDALLVNVSGIDLSNERAIQLRTFSRERDVPMLAVADKASPLLGATVTLMRPVLVGDVVAALDRLLVNPL